MDRQASVVAGSTSLLVIQGTLSHSGQWSACSKAALGVLFGDQVVDANAAHLGRRALRYQSHVVCVQDERSAGLSQFLDANPYPRMGIRLND